MARAQWRQFLRWFFQRLRLARRLRKAPGRIIQPGGIYEQAYFSWPNCRRAICRDDQWVAAFDAIAEGGLALLACGFWPWPLGSASVV